MSKKLTKSKKPLTSRVESRKANTARREEMDIRVLEFSIPFRKLNSAERSYIARLGYEATAFYNGLIEQSRITLVDDFGNLHYVNNIFKTKTKYNEFHLFQPHLGIHTQIVLEHLSSQMKQELLNNIKNSVKGLGAKKKKGGKVGKLKFKSQVTIPLSQFGITYKLSDDLRTVQFQGSKFKLRIWRNKAFSQFLKDLGYSKKAPLPQLLVDGNVEFGKAELKITATDYKLLVTVYFKKEALSKTKAFSFQLTETERVTLAQSVIGIDAGITDEMTFNIGSIEESIAVDSRQRMTPYFEDVKEAHAEYSKFVDKYGKNSRKAKKLKCKLNVAWEDYNNAKANMINHLKGLFNQFVTVYHQDENVKAWHANKRMHFSRKIQDGIIGKVYAALKEMENTIMHPKKASTTKTCVCGKINAIGLNDRVYHCPTCGYKAHRDTHSSYLMIVWDEVAKNKEKVANSELPSQCWESDIPTKMVYAIITRKIGTKAVGLNVRYQHNSFKPVSGIDSGQGANPAEFKEDSQALETLAEHSLERNLTVASP